VRYTFGDPFIGQFRVTLTSKGVVSSRTVDVRAMAAFPVNFVPVPAMSGRVGNHLEVVYKWASSSTRLADLDGVSMGEFVWATEKGYKRVHDNGLPPNKYWFKKPPFDSFMRDGFYMMIPSADVIAGAGRDRHARVEVIRGVAKSETQKQFFLYKIDDGFNYNKETDLSPIVMGDPYGEIRLRDTTIVWSVLPTGTGGWKLRIDKGSDGAIEIVMPNFPFLAL
jgi:hypothetical protein